MKVQLKNLTCDFITILRVILYIFFNKDEYVFRKGGQG